MIEKTETGMPAVVVEKVATNGFTLFADVAFQFDSGAMLKLRALRVQRHGQLPDTWLLSTPFVKIGDGQAVNAVEMPEAWKRKLVRAIFIRAETEGLALPELAA